MPVPARAAAKAICFGVCVCLSALIGILCAREGVCGAFAYDQQRPREFAYAATETGEILGFSVRSNGRLRPLRAAIRRTRVAKFPLALAAHPSGHFLYVATRDHASHRGAVFPYRVGRDGRLAPNGLPIAVFPSLEQLVLDPTGHYLYAVTEGTGSPHPTSGITRVFSVGRDGTLKAMATPTLDQETYRLDQKSGSQAGHSLVFVPGSGSAAFLSTWDPVQDMSIRTLTQYHVSAGGGLEPDPGADAANPIVSNLLEFIEPLCFVPRTRFVYVAEDDGCVQPFGVTKAGDIYAVKTPALQVIEALWENSRDEAKAAGRWREVGEKRAMGTAIAGADPRGRFLFVYADHRYKGHPRTLNSYKILPSGGLSLRFESRSLLPAGHPEPLGSFPHDNFTCDPSGRCAVLYPGTESVGGVGPDSHSVIRTFEVHDNGRIVETSRSVLAGRPWIADFVFVRRTSAEGR